MESLNLDWEMIRIWVTGGGTGSWIAAILVAFVLTGVLKLLLKGLELRLLELAQKTSVQWDDFLVENLGRLKSSVVFIWL
ncbi:MAG: hypothetical protein AB7F86_18445, partial [Bdellovibrionales bacterium]